MSARVTAVTSTCHRTGRLSPLEHVCTSVIELSRLDNDGLIRAAT